MGITEWWLNGRIHRIESRVKVLHRRQKTARRRLEEARNGHKRGTLSDAEFEKASARWETRLRHLTEEIARLAEAERDAKERLDAASEA